MISCNVSTIEHTKTVL